MFEKIIPLDRRSQIRLWIYSFGSACNDAAIPRRCATIMCLQILPFNLKTSLADIMTGNVPKIQKAKYTTRIGGHKSKADW